MRGFLRVAAIIHQCTRCHSLRDMKTERRNCRVCWHVLHVRHYKVRPLVLMDEVKEYEKPPTASVGLATAEECKAGEIKLPN